MAKNSRTPILPASPKYPPHIAKLPPEVLDLILEYCVPFFAKPFTVDRRSSLSVQSRTSQPPQLDEDGGDIKMRDWVMVCKRFREIGRRRQFATVVIRCSFQGFGNLEQIIQRPELAQYVKKFSYMFYGYSSLERSRFKSELNKAVEKRIEAQKEMTERANFLPRNNLNRQRQPALQRLSDDQLRMRRAHCIANEEAIRNMMMRVNEQRRIMEEGIDRHLLLEAMKTFGSNLEQIRLMRCEDAIEVGWHKFVSSDPGLAMELKTSRWSRGCEHATKTLLHAFAQSGCHPPRLSGRALNPQMSLLLANSLNTTVPVLHPMRLTCLELQFDDRVNLDEEMLELSELFQRGFTEAVNVQGLHISFTRPVSIPFESVFHDVHWHHLRYIGFGAWRLNSEDIIKFVHRHKKTLRAIRLRGVLLNEGSRWKDILKILRLEPKLKWASFRGVGYSKQEPQGTMYVPESDFDYDSDESEDFPGTDSNNVASSEEDEDNENYEEYEGDEEDEEDDGEELGGEQEIEVEGSLEGIENHEGGENSEESGYSDTDDGSAASENQDDRGDVEFEDIVNDYNPDDLEQYTDPAPPPQDPQLHRDCDCGKGFAWEDLENADDNERNPPADLWKWWQKWVIKRCLIHDPAASTLL